MKVIDLYNTAAAALVALMTAVFGKHWQLFAAYLVLNILDWLSGWYGARRKGEESSYVGMKGILKKVGYWSVMLIAWTIPACFMSIGAEIGVNLDCLQYLGWFVLAMLMVNEIRSVLENLVELGCKIPDILIKGLAVTERMIGAKSTISDEKGANEDD